MKKFDKQAAQGDLLITKIEKLPAGVKTKAVKGEVILAHSETGHHHAINAGPGIVEFIGSSNPLVSFMKVKKQPVELKHHRPFDTHESFEIGPGLYEVRRQRESTPEGWQIVAD